MRLRARMLATPVLRYRHASTGRALTLILNSHVGTAGYFRTMRQRIAELEERGAVVQVEGITKAPAAQWAAVASDDERAAQQVLARFYRDERATLAGDLGWVSQKDAFPVAGSWVNVDLNDLEVIRAAGAGAILAMAAAADERMARFGKHGDQFSRAVTPLFLRALARDHAPLSRAVAQFAPDVDTVLLQQRSALAVAAVDPARDTVMVWGAGHADSIGAGLTAAGWVLTGRRRWLNVGLLPPYWRSLADLTVVACGVGADTFKTARAAAIAAGDHPAG
jgi:hypothetical protein